MGDTTMVCLDVRAALASKIHTIVMQKAACSIFA